MNRVSLVSVTEYKTFQYHQLVEDYRAMIRGGYDGEWERYNARTKWGLDGDGAQLAYMEARVMEDSSAAA